MTGEILPDIIFQESWGNIFNQSLSEIWNSPIAVRTRELILAGEVPMGCRPCRRKEASIGTSRRLYFKNNRLLGDEREQLTDMPDIRFLEINLSNLCNLKCRMCSSAASTAWVSEEMKIQALGRTYPRMLGFRREAPGLAKISADDLVDRLFEDPSAFRNLKNLCLRGGEPFLEKANMRFLRRLREFGIGKDLSVDISTNGSIVDHEFLALLSDYDVKLHISLEGTGALYGYIRGGKEFRLEELEQNLEAFNRLPRARIVFAVTMMAYNIFDVTNLWDWFERVADERHEIYFRNIVVQPAYLHPHILPFELRRQAAERIRAREIPERTKNPRQTSSGAAALAESLLRDIHGPDDAKRLQEQLVQYTQDIDSFRGTCITDVVPELRPLFHT